MVDSDGGWREFAGRGGDWRKKSEVRTKKSEVMGGRAWEREAWERRKVGTWERAGPQRRLDPNMAWTYRCDANGNRASSACGTCRK